MDWQARSSAGLALEPAQLASELQISQPAAELLLLRMADWREPSIEAARKFLQPSLKDLPNPFLLKDMGVAVERVLQAVTAGETIAIYGDYDVDGTCAAALLARFFRKLGITPFIYQPDRLREGYGLNSAAIELLAGKGIHLLITVDCGISNAAEVARAKELGIDVIVCDHHHVPPAMPLAAAVLNHKRTDDDSPIKSLCGTGMSFYLAMGIRAKLREKSWFTAERPEPDLKQLLDLVALASVADMVPLVEENRILTSVGLQKMRASPLTGIKAICSLNKVDLASLDTYHLGFVIGPRINAAGRLDSANIAFQLLTTDDENEALALAKRLDDLNSERARLTERTFIEAREKAEAWLKRKSDAVALVVAGDNWHEGVIGIVASRLQEEFKRAAIVVTFQTHNGIGKGSGRSSHPHMHITNALSECAELLEKFGGHQAAAGLSVKRENFDEFANRLEASLSRQVSSPDQKQNFWFDMPLENFQALQNGLCEELSSFAPFGMGNPEPVLLARALEIKDLKVIKEKHLKLSVSHRDGFRLSGFWPNGARNHNYAPGDEVNILFSPQISQFRGKKELEMRIHRMQK